MDLTLLTHAQVLGLTGAAEARAKFVPGRGWEPAPIEDMVAVMCTPINRAKSNPARFGADVSDACFEHAQYSCWNPGGGAGSQNHQWLLDQAAAILGGKYVAPVVQHCIAAAEQLLDGTQADTVNGATSYYSPISMVPGGRVPIWARGQTPVATVGNQVFFKDV